MYKILLGFTLGTLFALALANIFPASNIFGKLDGYCYKAKSLKDK